MDQGKIRRKKKKRIRVDEDRPWEVVKRAHRQKPEELVIEQRRRGRRADEEQILKPSATQPFAPISQQHNH